MEKRKGRGAHKNGSETDRAVLRFAR